MLRSGVRCVSSYHYGGLKSDAELNASQLRSRYEVMGRAPGASADDEYRHPGWSDDSAAGWPHGPPPQRVWSDPAAGGGASSGAGSSPRPLGMVGGVVGSVFRLTKCCDEPHGEGGIMALTGMLDGRSRSSSAGSASSGGGGHEHGSPLDRDLHASVARSLHWNSAREKARQRARLLRLLGGALCGAVFVLGALFVLSAPDALTQHAVTTSGAVAAFSDRVAAAVGLDRGSASVAPPTYAEAGVLAVAPSTPGRPAPIAHRRPLLVPAGGFEPRCASLICAGDAVALDVLGLLRGHDRAAGVGPWSATGTVARAETALLATGAAAGAARARVGQEAVSGAADEAGLVTCGARVLLVADARGAGFQAHADPSTDLTAELPKLVEAGGLGPGDAGEELGLELEGEEKEEEEEKEVEELEEEGPRLLLVLAEGWAGQAAFWLREDDPSLLPLGPTAAGVLGGGGSGLRGKAAAPAAAATTTFTGGCPFSFASLGEDAGSVLGRARCSVAMRDYCELSAPEPAPVWALPRAKAAASGLKGASGPPEPLEALPGSSGRKPRRAAACSVATPGAARAAAAAATRGSGGGVSGASRARGKSKAALVGRSLLEKVGPAAVQQQVPAAWRAAQQDGATLGVCPPPAALAWAPDRWSYPDCSASMRRTLTELILQVQPASGDKAEAAEAAAEAEGPEDVEGAMGAVGAGGDDDDAAHLDGGPGASQRLWRAAQEELAEDGLCPRPGLALWLPDATTHPRCGGCIADACAEHAARAERIMLAVARPQRPPKSPLALGEGARGGAAKADRHSDRVRAALANQTAALEALAAHGAVAGAGKVSFASRNKLGATSAGGPLPSPKKPPPAEATSWKTVGAAGEAGKGGDDASDAGALWSLGARGTCGDPEALSAAWAALGPGSGRSGGPSKAVHARVLADFVSAQRFCSLSPADRGVPGAAGVGGAPSAAQGSGAPGTGKSGAGLFGGAEEAWATGGLLDGACPAPEVVRWVPDELLAFRGCAAGLQRRCTALAGDLVASAAASPLHPRGESPASGAAAAAACASGGEWISAREAALAAAAQRAAAKDGACPWPDAGGRGAGPAAAQGFLWAAHERPAPRSALSSRFCELPL